MTVRELLLKLVDIDRDLDVEIELADNKGDYHPIDDLIIYAERGKLIVVAK